MAADMLFRILAQHCIIMVVSHAREHITQWSIEIRSRAFWVNWSKAFVNYVIYSSVSCQVFMLSVATVITKLIQILGC